mmetsp:Transcript_11596/g.27252  ORF Transcript_11596/g.27252 Transcript_11596/m.27252 type:complete len:229 (+) Transcript_11596:6-692(+)
MNLKTRQKKSKMTMARVADGKALLLLTLLAQVATGFQALPHNGKFLKTAERRVQGERQLLKLWSDPDDDNEEASYKKQLRAQNAAEFDAKKDELDALRARIRMVAEEQELEEATPWTPDMPTKNMADSPPEMTGAVGKMAKLLGDDRAKDEYDEEGDEWDDPLDGLPQYQQLLEEAKQITWPAPGKIATSTVYVYMGMIGAVAYVQGLDTLFKALGEAIGFKYGVNQF